MGMHVKTLLLLVVLTTPVLTGCIAGDADTSDLPRLDGPSFSVGAFVHDLETATGASLVSARVDNLQVEYNQSRVTLVDWRSFTPDDDGCELVSTMVYEGHGRSGGFLVHHEGEPCPVSLQDKPTVAEAVALVDRVSLEMVRTQVLDGAPIFGLQIAGYCGYTAATNASPVYRWNGAGLTAVGGEVTCGGGTNSALALVATVPGHGRHASPQAYILLEQVPSRGS